MSKKLLFVFLSVFTVLGVHAQQSFEPNGSEWVVKNPFQRDVFIRNNGQFTKYEKDNVGNILYYTRKGRLHLYFTNNGIDIRTDSLYVAKDGDANNETNAKGEEDDLKNFRGKTYFLKMQWQGANPNAWVEAQGMVSDYFTYPNPADPTGHTGITANAWQKLIYHNLYPGIDLELFYPTKGGIEYNIIVHPGADPSVVKMHYSGDLSINEVNKDVHINWICKLADHAPTAKDEDGKSVPASFNVNNNTISFTTGNYDKTKTLTIDPWITGTSLGGTNQAYDIGYDLLGNVYVYGGGANVSYTLQKYNSGGALQWTYTTTYTYIYGSSYFYGDLSTDVRDGTSYICEGFDPAPACSVIKVSTAGVQQAKGPGTTTDEEWRIGIDYCTNELCLATGGESGITACHLDTNCTTMTGVNMLGGSNVWDQALLNFDNVGNVYIGTSNMYGNVATPYGNMLCKMPLPSMTPTTYQVFDHHDFIEIQNITYYPAIPPYVAGNGFNGLAATSTRVYTYDGGKLRCWKGSNGTILDSATVSGTSYAWGGLTIDCDGDVFCGNNKSVSEYDSSCNSLGTLALSNTVYDLAVSPHGYIYACGNGYVQCLAAPHKLAKVIIVQPGCGCTGSVTANPCGKGPFTYSWSNGATTSSITGLCSGTYTLTVKTGGCLLLSDTAIATLTASGGSLTTTITPTNIPCNGGNTGSITTTVAGGTSPYTYAWNPGGQTTSSVTGLTAGSYTCVVKDHTGCIDTLKTTITQPTALTGVTTVVNVKCNGGATGSSTVTAGGGTTAYAYAWTPGGQTSSTATGLTAGTYTVTVTDAHGCIVTATATITQPTALTASTTTTTATCGNSDGSATVTAGGGTPGYNYSWTPGGQTSTTASSLSAGVYTVTVTDANGCTITTTAAVSSASGETITVTGTTNVSCNGGANGTINTTTAGGTGPYNYSWSPSGGTNSNATGLSAGSYTVTVTDVNGCVATASATITQPTAITAATTTTPVSCNAGSNGGATVTAGGGTPGYNYSWAPGGQTTSAATGLTAGTYTVTITDANGCTLTATATVTQPTALTAATTTTPNSCNGGSNGSATITAGGGTPGYNYSWAPGGQTSSTATGLTAGTYTVTITDANGCTLTSTATVAQPTALTASTTTTSAACGKANGSATVTAGGGTPGYNYSWAPGGQTSSTATSLTAGTYTVTITDANGCTLTATAIVTNASGETVTISGTTNVLCNGGTNGSINTTTAGGTLPYTYNWTPSAQTNANATGLSAGTYTVTVTDANGCISTASATITQPTVLTATTANTPVKCNAGATGTVSVTAGGGTPAYAYSWAPGGQTSSTATSLTAGTYTVTITDANGCTLTASATITQPPVLTLTAAGFPVTCNGGSDGQATVIPGGGTPAYTYLWSNGSTVANVNNLSAGNYTITVTDANGCTHDTTVTVTQPAPIVVAFTADTISGCAPLCTGFVDGTTDPGGTITKWKWSYSDGGSDTVKDPRHCFTNPGSYNVTLTVTDNHGCTSTLTINNMITVYTSPVAAFTFGPQPTTIIYPQIQFADKSTDAYGIASWLWNFNDPTNEATSTQQNPSHSYGDTGTFCAELTVTNIHGCVDSVTECLVISPQFTLYIPNAFTPNGDGLNDVFQPKGEFVKDFKMYIFDRWGMLLYSTTDITKGWNGSVNNGTRICQEDTYVYMIQATDNLGQQHSYIGKVTLLQ